MIPFDATRPRVSPRLESRPRAPMAIIAGAGQFPVHMVQAARRQGVPVIVMGITGWVDPTLAQHVDHYEEVAIGQLRRLIERLTAQGVTQAIMAGKVTKAVLLDPHTQPDDTLQAVLREARDASVPALLGAIGQQLALAGITLLDSSTFLKDDLCPLGVVTSRGPTAREQEDGDIGLRVARALASLDVGQTVVVKERVVVALEALEGTDAAIRRAHALAGRDVVVVKTASPNHDRRFDLPVIGRETITTCRECGVSYLVEEAMSTLLLDRQAVVAMANRAGMCLTGVTSAYSV